MGLLGWVLGNGGGKNSSGSTDSSPRDIVKKMVSGDYKTDPLALLRVLIEKALGASESGYKNTKTLHGRAPAAYIKEGRWKVEVTAAGLQIVYRLNKGELKLDVVPVLRDRRLKTISLAPVSGRVSESLKSGYITPVADMLKTYFKGKEVKIIY